MSEQQALLDCLDLARAAVKAETQVCAFCRNSIFFYDWHRALVKGHCYSIAGRREVRISQTCEYCFDELADSLDEEGDDDDTTDSSQASTTDPFTG